jgi:hypothetical protein
MEATETEIETAGDGEPRTAEWSGAGGFHC